MNQIARHLTPLAVYALLLVVLIALLGLTAPDARSAIEPGATVRNNFGPDAGFSANRCRGACGGGCPKSCEIEVTYECTGATQLRRVEAFTCGTHQGCREHDDCLDNCMLQQPGSKECQPQCDAQALERHGASAASWLLGGGPFDGHSRFEYTRRGPEEPEPAYRCPEGATRKCGTDAACIRADGTAIDPVFDSYPTAAGNMQISRLQTGPLCPGGGQKVCEQSATIRVTGADTCPGGNCTRFGMAFDYRNADPSAPLKCSTSTRSDESDFVGDLIKLGGDSIANRNATTGGPEEGDGQGQLLDAFAKVIASGDSAEDVDISMTPLDENGNPIESQRVGSASGGTPPPIPRTIPLPATSGHLLIPMYQLTADTKLGTSKERRVTCTHKGAPVLETVFVLHIEDNPDATTADRESARLRQSAEEMERAFQKSTQEQKNFEQEADALEAELGF